MRNEDDKRQLSVKLSDTSLNKYGEPVRSSKRLIQTQVNQPGTKLVVKKTVKRTIRNYSEKMRTTIKENIAQDEKEKLRRSIICDNFVLMKEIGKGTFGTIFLTYNLRENLEVATKTELKKGFKSNPQLKMEFLVLKSILNLNALFNTLAVSKGFSDYTPDFTGFKRIPHPDIQGFPNFYGYGLHYDRFYLILQLLGPNLSNLFNFCSKNTFSVTTVCLMALQMIARIEYLHKHYYLHRDIKPENFLMGSGDKSNIIYLIDFGLCKKYKDPNTGQHIPYRENRILTGTARYVSINTHMGVEQSRRDDLESIGYLFIYFLKGTLPWVGIKGNKGNNNADKNMKIAEKKLQLPTEILCYGLPEEFSIYLHYVKNLRFEDRPDYDFLKGLFVKRLNLIITLNELKRDQINFDWSLQTKTIKKADSSFKIDALLSKKLQTATSLRMLKINSKDKIIEEIEQQSVLTSVANLSNRSKKSEDFEKNKKSVNFSKNTSN